MLLPFLALIQTPQNGLRLVPITAQDSAQAIGIAGQLCVRDGMPDALIVAMFNEQDIANAHRLIEQAKDAIATSG